MMTNLRPSLLSCLRLRVEKQNTDGYMALKRLTYRRKESIADMTFQEPGPGIEDIYPDAGISDVFGELLEIQSGMLASRDRPYTFKNRVEDQVRRDDDDQARSNTHRQTRRVPCSMVCEHKKDGYARAERTKDGNILRSPSQPPQAHANLVATEAGTGSKTRSGPHHA